MEKKKEEILKICVCGGGNGSHVTAGYVGNKKNFIVNVLTRNPQKWIDGMKENGGMKVWCRSVGEKDLKPIIGKINLVSDKAEEVCKDVDVFICGGPSHANPVYLEKIAPFVKKGAMIGALYAQGGFDWAVRQIFGKKFEELELTMFGLLHIPWICKAFKYGSECKMIGPKKYLQVATFPLDRNEKVKALCQALFDIPTRDVPNFLNLTLVPSNQIIHPPRYYGIFKDWDGKKKYDPKKIPALYAELDDFSAEEMQKVSDELLMVRDAIIKEFPNVDLSQVKDLGKRVVEQYAEDVEDPTNLKTIFCTNNGYKGCVTPVVMLEDGQCQPFLLPEKLNRFTIEDIPYGLCILRNIGEIFGVKTPKFDWYIRWFQKWMGKEYLFENGKLNEKLINETGTPFRYGLKSKGDVVQNCFPTKKKKEIERGDEKEIKKKKI